MLVKQKIYTSSMLSSEGVILAKLGCNREVDGKAVSKKVDSIKAANGIISASLIVPAKKCIDQGLDVFLEDGTEVTLETENLDKIYVIVDGQHRKKAVEELNKGEKKFENYYYLPLCDDFNVSVLLRESNVATYPWKDQQYLSNLLSVSDRSSDVKFDFLEEVNSHPGCKTKALVQWFLLDLSRTLYARDIVAAMLDPQKLKEIADFNVDKFNLGKRMFSALSDKLTESEAGKTVYSDWCISKINENCMVPATETGEQLIKFFKSLSEAEALKLKRMKGSRSGSVVVTRDSQVQTELTRLYDVFKSKSSEE